VDPLTCVALAAADGDRDALSSFVRSTQGDVWSLCAYLVDREDADDLTQEVYLRALPSLDRLHGGSNARAWLLAIARNTCRDAIARRVRGRRLRDRLAGQRPTVPRDPSGELDLTELVGALGLERREAFVLTQLLGFSYEETARLCRCPVGTVRSRVARARADLARHLAGDESPDLTT
jgi:RNA polymerase sigma-70 factor, ECF subfamily